MHHEYMETFVGGLPSGRMYRSYSMLLKRVN